MPYHDMVGLRSCNRDRATPGYTLFSPLGQRATYLVDMNGEVVHEWANPSHPGNYGYLLANGNLLIGLFTEDGPQGLAAKGGRICEIDWDGNIVWEHVDENQHHDFRRLDNGNTVYLAWELYDKATAARIKGGMAGTEREEGMYGDVLREVDRDGNIVWEWQAARHLEIENYPISPTAARKEFGHGNTVFPLENGDFLVNWRTTNLMVIIDRKTKAVKWEMADLAFGQQHDVQILANGNMLFFANAADATNFGPEHGSRIIELDPETKEIVWEYKAKPGYAFFSWFISGCQRLASGNTLICQGVWGRLFEVTQEGEVVWDYISPYFVPDGAHPAYQNGNFIFRCYRYAADGGQIAGRLPADPW
ncbi:MAG: aryl-sulfate sulfotransferase [Alphaproteobacteria bacterium]|nr:aryl-sulfate sulfotransferase [Alphaproteobacteria bacterium]